LLEEFLKRLHDQRNVAWEAMKAVVDAAVAESRDMNAEEEAAYQRANADLDSVDERIRSIGERIENERRADEARARYEAALRPRDDEPGARRGEATQEDRLLAFLRGEGGRSFDIEPTPEEARSLTKGTPSAGGNLVPTSFWDMLWVHLVYSSAIRRAGATVLTTPGGENLQVPKTTAHSAAAIVGEGAPIGANEPAFGQVTMGAFKYAYLVQVARELLDDENAGVLAYLASDVGRALGDASGAHFVTGTGSGQPTGLLTVTTLGKTAAAANAVTFDEIIDLFFSVIPGYRANGSFLMTDSTLGAVRKLKDNNGAYIWSPGPTVGAPDTILGRPVFSDPNVAAIATGAKTIAFGDLSRYLIRQVGGVRFERSDDFAFSSDLVTFRAILRTDGNLVDRTGAVKHLAQA
jgi:HK97 family phage major capsid protein